MFRFSLVSLGLNILFIVSCCAYDLVDVRKALPGVIADPMYSKATNFTRKVLYDTDTCYVHKDLVEPLQRALAIVRKQGYTFKILDGYRPHSVQFKLWELVPVAGFVAEPTAGSNHNRGVAVDITLVDIKTGQEVEMPSAPDEFSARSWADYKGCRNKEAVRLRDLLASALKSVGLVQNPQEWWHFALAPTGRVDKAKYPILNVGFQELAKG